MDITAAISNRAYNDVDRTFSEIIPFSANNTLNNNLAVLLRKKSVTKRDAIQTVKLDPAVLEAQVTSHSARPSSPATTDSSDHEDQAIVAKTKEVAPTPASFADMVSMQQAALLSLTPHQYELLMNYADTLRRQRRTNQMNLECAFCKNNGESVSWYSSHALRSWRGRVLCPVLRALRCPRCGATGDRAHTIKYCPENHDTDFLVPR